MSDLVDRIVSEARSGGWADPASVRSVAATIDLPEDDPNLEAADAYIRTLFASSTRQPLLARERPAPKARGKKGTTRG